MGATERETFTALLLELDRSGAESFLEELSGTMGKLELVEEVVAPALETIGDMWERGDASLSQVYMGGRLCEELVERSLVVSGSPGQSTLTLAIVALEDFHLLGKRIVYSVLQAAGYPVEDWGNAGVEATVRMVRERGVNVLLVSTLMLRAALKIRELKERLEEEGLAVTLIVGGAPFRFDPQLAGEVGAHHWVGQASQVLPLIRRLEGEAS